MSTTVEIAEYPGYYWQWNEHTWNWCMKYAPASNVYSPPVLDCSVEWIHMAAPKAVTEDDLRKIRTQSEAVYITYREDLQKIEIWGLSDAIHQTVMDITIYLNEKK